MRNIIVYRDRLFAKSEIAFMRRQYMGFSQAAPLWTGRRLEPGPVPEGFALGPQLTGADGLAFKLAGMVPNLAAFRALNPLCVHAQFGRGGALALPLAEALGVPLIVTFHGSEVDKASYYRMFPLPSLFALRMERLKAYASAFVCISENARARLLARGFPAEKTYALPIGTDVIAPGPRENPGEGIVFAGRFAEMKGIFILLDALRILRSQGFSAPFTIIGDGPLRTGVTRAAAGIDGLAMPGWLDQAGVRAAMAGARALCVPSMITAGGESEGLPSVAVEAMGLGVPVVASTEARTEGLVLDGETGLITPARDAPALAAALGALLTDTALAARLGATARAHVAVGFYAPDQSKALEALLLTASGAAVMPPAPPPVPDAGAIKAAMQTGLRHHQAGELDTAQRFYREALAADPRQADALHLLGVIAHQRGEDEAAAGLIGQAIAVSPGFASYHANLGNVLVALGRFEAGIAAYDSALRLQPDFAEAHYNLGNAYLALERFDSARAAYNAALRLRPEYAEALANRGKAQMGLGQTEAAIESFEAALRLRPDDLAAHHRLGGARMAQEDFAAALAAYDTALRLRPDHATSLSDRGLALLRLGRPGDALASFEAALRLTPGQAAAHRNLGIALDAMGRAGEAIAAFEAALRLTPDDADTSARLRFALYRRAEMQGEYEAAFAHLREGNRLRRAGIVYEEGLALRLMDRLQRVFNPALLGRAAAPGGPPDVPVFILGMPRSGSTLIEQILSAHRSVSGGGELPFLGDAVAGLRGSYPDNIASCSAAELAAAAAAYRARLQALDPAAARITDKMPANFHHIGFIHLALPRAKIIHTRRDPVDTCFSCFAQSFTDGQPFTNDLDELGRYYRAYARLMAHWRASLPAGAMLEVEYEALVTDFEPQVRRILDYCELDWDPACLAFYENERVVLTASAQQVRQKLYQHAAGRTQPYGALLSGLRAIVAP